MYNNDNRNDNRPERYQNNYRSNRSNENRSNQPRTDNRNQNRAPTNYVSIIDGNDYETDEEDEEIIALWNENFDSFGNQKGIKRKEPTEPELIYDYRTDPKRNRKEVRFPQTKPKPMEWTPTVNKKKPILKTPEKTKFVRTKSKLLQVPQYDVVKKIKEQKLEITLPQLLDISPTAKKEFIESLRKPKEVSASLANHENNSRTTTLECNIIINGFKVPATIDSGAATSIIARNTMEQLGFDIEEATNCKIISANGEKNESLGKIKDFPVEINDRTIPINVEVMETEAYHILLGNDWMMKAGAAYDWKKQELTINWRNQTIKTTATCKQNNELEDIEEIEEYSSEDDDNEHILFQGKYTQN
jgi:hypothetical protein